VGVVDGEDQEGQHGHRGPRQHRRRLAARFGPVARVRQARVEMGNHQQQRREPQQAVGVHQEGAVRPEREIQDVGQGRQRSQEGVEVLRIGPPGKQRPDVHQRAVFLRSPQGEREEHQRVAAEAVDPGVAPRQQPQHVIVEHQPRKERG
jgi:hypothetical protein